MSNDFLVEIMPELNGQLALIVRANNLPQLGQRLPRQPFNLEIQLIDQLRRGDALPALVQQVTAAVSTWLLGNDLKAYLLAALFGGRMRLVFSMDERLRAALADLPVELLELDGGVVPLALNPQVSAIVHLLEKVGVPQNSPSARSWPLRVLIVRSNPNDLGGSVPKGAPIRDEIIQLGKKLDPSLVKVDLLSSEVGVARPATWDAFREQLRKTPYDVVVYLGHGDLLPANEGLPPSGVLQMENDDAEAHTPVSAKQLAAVLYNNPVPVVILAGCLTAAEVPIEKKQSVEESIPQWMRGSQGVAQALVNSESGVQFAVGMRYRLETHDAVKFLHAFFQSLLLDKPGNAEEAVRAGRTELHAISPYAASWAAPVIFSTRVPEPMFEFLATPPHKPIEAFDEQAQEIRNIFWKSLVQQPLSKRPPGGIAPVNQVLADMEQRLRGDPLNKGPLMMPPMVEASAGQTVTLPIELYGQLDLDVLRGKVVVSGEAINFQSVQRTQALKERGYQVLAAREGNEIMFRIERTQDNGGGPLPEGPLFEITLTLGAVFPIVYLVNVNILAIEPHTLIRSGNNAIIVPPL